MKIHYSFAVAAVILILLMVSCSKGKNPVGNPVSSDVPIDAYQFSNAVEDNRSMLAVYDAVIDPDVKTFKVTFSERSADYHIPVSKYYPNVLKVINYGWTPNFWADIKITHPFPLSAVVGFDPRVIAIIPANNGVSFFYPVFNVKGNNKAVMNSDGYTPLWDELGGSIDGNVNPFIAYFKNYPYRIWEASNPEDTQRWSINLDGFGGPMKFKLVVDVSTNYPQIGIPIQDNAPEPVQISTIVGDGLTPEGGNAEIKVTLLDWQGQNGTKCSIESPDLFNGTIQLLYSVHGPNPDEYIFTGTISNNLLAPDGEYYVLIAAWDEVTDVHIFSEATALVQIVNFNPIDITPPGLNFSPYGVSVDGSFAYISGGTNGFHIFDISNPVNPVWMSSIDAIYGMRKASVSGNYAYVEDSRDLLIVDINPPQSAHVVKSVGDVFQNLTDIHVSDDYAYLLEWEEIVSVDIEPPELAHPIGLFYTSNDSCFDMKNQYAYVPEYNDGAWPYERYLNVLDMSDPQSPKEIQEVGKSYPSRDLKIAGDHIYSLDHRGVEIFTFATFPQAAKTADFQLPTRREPKAIDISGDYAFVGCDTGDFYALDVNPPEMTNIVKTIQGPVGITDISIGNGYAYVGSFHSGLSVVDIDPPESSEIVTSVFTPGFAMDVDISGRYLYIAEGGLQNPIPPPNGTLKIVDILDPGSPVVINSINLSACSGDVCVENGYAYATTGDHKLQILDIDPPQSAYIVNSVELPESDPLSIYVSNGYVYVGMLSYGLQIIDVDPPELASVVKVIDLAGDHVGDIDISGDYAYVIDNTYGSGFKGIRVVDINPPESAEIVNSIEVNYSRIAISGNYLYSLGVNLDIYDLTIPQSPALINSVDILNGTYDLGVSGGYAYLAAYNSLEIIDVDPPDSAFVVVNSGFQSFRANRIHVFDRYIYGACQNEGLRVIKLW